MSTWDLVLRSLRFRWVATLLNVVSVTLGVGLVCSFLSLQAELYDRFSEPGRGYGLVVGAPGSALQLVLSAVFHMEESPGRVPFALWDELEAHPSVALVVPYAVGDSFRGFPVVATTDAFFDPRFPHPAAEDPAGKLAHGRPLHFHREELDEAHAGEHSEHAHQEAVVGAEVAETLGLRVGDRIEPSHGIEEGAMAHEHEELWEVVGILEPTDSAVDRIVLINLDSFFRIEEHDHSDEAALSSLLVFPRRGVHTAVLLGELRGRSDLQVAHVATEVRRLLDLIGRVDGLFLLAAGLVVWVSLLSIFTSVYTATRARRGELGVLRALGVPRTRLLSLVVVEAAAVALVGALAGWLLGHLVLFFAGGWIESVGGIRADPWRLMWSEAAVVALVTAAGALAGLVPGVQAYRIDVATVLRQSE